MSLNYKNLDETASFKKLKTLGSPVSLKSVLNAERVKKYSVLGSTGITYNFAAKQVNDPILSILQELSDEQELIAKYKEILSGTYMNVGENRMVLHHLTRGQLAQDVVFEGKNLRSFYADEQKKAYSFAAQVHGGKILSSTGKAFTTVVQIGIGGSDLGPRAMYLALENYARGAGIPLKLTAQFISNVDPDDASSIMRKIDLETSLFVLVSKSGTTQETLANETFVKTALSKKGLDPKKHIVAVTSETSPLAKNPDYLTSFYIDDFIGGRYSSTSAVGGCILALALGEEIVSQFLEGALAADKLALETNIWKNPALMDALIGVYERNIQGYSATAVLPYSQAMSRFPAHLQQLDMESNGKMVNRFNKKVDYATGPVIFGEPGTNGQHSFYQLLHQGTDVVPLQFIGFIENQMGQDVTIEGSTSQQKLKANLAAQIIAFAKGSANDNPNKDFPGERPASLLWAPKLTPQVLGGLLAHFENKVMFQGLLWNINSFDQEGVQLGKVLTKAVLAKGKMDDALQAFSDLLKV